MMVARIGLSGVMAVLLVFFSIANSAAQTVQYRESDFDFLSLKTYDTARAAMSKWLAVEIDAGGDPTAMPHDVERAWSALVREAARKGIVSGKGNGDGDEALRTQLISDALKGTSAAAWNGTYKGKPVSSPTRTAGVEPRGWDPTEREWDPTERGEFDPIQTQSRGWDPSSTAPAAPAAPSAAFDTRSDMPTETEVNAQQLQTISNVSKMLHDTAMAVIRKIG